MLKDVLFDNTTLIDIDIKDKIDLFTKITKISKEKGYISDEQGVIEDFYAKEQNTETYLGTECAIPHARSSRILKNVIFFVRVKNTIKWSDEDNAKFIFAILAKEDDVDKHIDMLMAVSKKVLDLKVLDVLRKSNSREEILEILCK